MSNEYFEILAPAGGPEALKAAVFAGADAVYLGGPAFGARASAKNFSREELAEAARFCHGRGVRVHVTVNTLLKDRELPDALDFVEYLCSLPVDAVLVQDMGLFSLLRQWAPALPVHASTQMSLHTPGGVKLLWELGASRVVLSRELSLEEIREIRRACPVEPARRALKRMGAPPLGDASPKVWARAARLGTFLGPGGWRPPARLAPPQAVSGAFFPRRR